MASAFVLKRTSWAQDWIARATRDHALREGFVASGQLPLPAPFASPYLGAAADGTAVAMLMPDLSDRARHLGTARRRPDHDLGVAGPRCSAALARLHATPAGGAARPSWAAARGRGVPSASDCSSWAGHRRSSSCATASPAGDRFLAGWARVRPARTAGAPGTWSTTSPRDPGPLLAALATLPDALLHGDLKVANVAFLDGDRIALHRLADGDARAGRGGARLVARLQHRRAPDRRPTRSWRAISRRPTPSGPCRSATATAQVDLTWIVGLLLRGWRKGLDAEAGLRLASGVAAADDLAWWCERAVEAAARRL